MIHDDIFHRSFYKDRFNSKSHPRTELERKTVGHMADIRKHVELTPDEMATKLTHNLRSTGWCRGGKLNISTAVEINAYWDRSALIIVCIDDSLMYVNVCIQWYTITVNWPDHKTKVFLGVSKGFGANGSEPSHHITSNPSPTPVFKRCNVQVPLPRKVMAKMANLIQLQSFQPNWSNWFWMKTQVAMEHVESEWWIKMNSCTMPCSSSTLGFWICVSWSNGNPGIRTAPGPTNCTASSKHCLVESTKKRAAGSTSPTQTMAEQSPKAPFK